MRKNTFKNKLSVITYIISLILDSFNKYVTPRPTYLMILGRRKKKRTKPHFLLLCLLNRAQSRNNMVYTETKTHHIHITSSIAQCFFSLSQNQKYYWALELFSFKLLFTEPVQLWVRSCCSGHLLAKLRNCPKSGNFAISYGSSAETLVLWRILSLYSVRFLFAIIHGSCLLSCSAHLRVWLHLLYSPWVMAEC